MSGSPRPFDAQDLRKVLGSFVTGVTVITTRDRAGAAHGLTVNSFSSVSLDPPLILWSQALAAPSHPVFMEADRFVVNILADDQVDTSNRFARSGVDKFADTAVESGIGDIPMIQGCAAHLECRRVHSYPGGDHVVFIGEVERIWRHSREPLVFGGGRYLVAQPHDLGPTGLPLGTENIARLKAVRVATRALTELSDELDETLGLGVWGNKGPTVVRWEESSQPVSDNLRTGLVLPVLTSATGLAFAAWLPREFTAPFVDVEMVCEAGNSWYPDAERLTERLAQIRRAGVAQLVGTDQFADLYGSSISAVSVPVFDPSGAMILALTAIGASDRLDTKVDGRLVTSMRRCANAIERKLTPLSSVQA